MIEVVIAGTRQTEVGERWNIKLHKFPRVALIFLLLVLIVAGCAPKPTEPVLKDSFFSGQALLDANGNGEIDSADTPVENATLIVTLQGGGEFGDNTDEAGKAFVTVPGKVDYPVELRMEAPKDSSLALIKPLRVILSGATGEPIQFLFSSK